MSKNKTITRGWPPERRAKQAERMRERKAWKHSTGPKTERGKATSATNAYKHGWHSAEMDIIAELLRRQKALISSILSDHT